MGGSRVGMLQETSCESKVVGFQVACVKDVLNFEPHRQLQLIGDVVYLADD